VTINSKANSFKPIRALSPISKLFRSLNSYRPEIALTAVIAILLAHEANASEDLNAKHEHDAEKLNEQEKLVGRSSPANGLPEQSTFAADGFQQDEQLAKFSDINLEEHTASLVKPTSNPVIASSNNWIAVDDHSIKNQSSQGRISTPFIALSDTEFDSSWIKSFEDSVFSQPLILDENQWLFQALGKISKSLEGIDFEDIDDVLALFTSSQADNKYLLQALQVVERIPDELLPLAVQPNIFAKLFQRESDFLLQDLTNHNGDNFDFPSLEKNTAQLFTNLFANEAKSFFIGEYRILLAVRIKSTINFFSSQMSK